MNSFCQALLRSVEARFDCFLEDTVENNEELRPFLAAQLLDVTTRGHWTESIVTDMAGVLANYAIKSTTNFQFMAQSLLLRILKGMEHHRSEERLQDVTMDAIAIQRAMMRRLLFAI